MKSRIIALVIIGIFLLSCKKQQDNKLHNQELSSIDIQGTWQWIHNSDKRDFTITIKINNDSINGSICSIAQFGNRVDCANGQNSFTLKNNNKLPLSFSFKTFYEDGQGRGKIIMTNKDTLIWEITQTPKAQFFIPEKAEMVRRVANQKK